MPRFTYSLLLGVAVLVGVTSCRKPAESPAPVDLTIHFTCDTQGRLVPCGCFSGQLGGLTRLHTMLDLLAATNSIRVDVGDAIGGAEDYHRIQYGNILAAYSKMGFVALNMGQREARLDAGHLKQFAETNSVPMISANLLAAETGEPLLAPFTLIERSGMKIGILGVTDDHAIRDELGEGVKIGEMSLAISQALPKLKAATDVLILLAFTDEPGLRKLAEEFYEFDLILGGRVQQSAQELERANRSYIYYTANKSRTLGSIMLRHRPGERSKVTGNDIMLLTPQIPQHKEIKALAADYRKKIRTTKLDIDDPEKLKADQVPGVRLSSGYVGSDACMNCHQDAFKKWKRSRHAHAFRSLELFDADADADPTCIACHTVGFGTVSGYQRKFGKTKFTDVGCESCHGPGSQHVDQYTKGGDITFKFRPLGKDSCRKCHYGEFSRPFDWDSFWPPVKHGKEPKGKLE